MFEINSKEFSKKVHVKVDGIPMEFKAVGAGSELAQQQRERRINFLQKKVDAGTITEDELTLLEKLEEQTLTIFSDMLGAVDGNEKDIERWIYDTPTNNIIATFNNLKEMMEKEDGATEEATEKANES